MSNLDPREAAAARTKICLLYGALSAAAGALLTLGLYFAGLQEDLHGVELSSKIGLVGLVFPIVAAFLGVRAARATVPPWDNFAYGAAFWAATRILFVSLIIGTAFYLLYYTLINPALQDVMLQQRLKMLAEKGLSDSDIEKASGIQRFTLKPAMVAVFALLFGTLYNVIVALVLAAVVKRPGKAVTVPQPPLL